MPVRKLLLPRSNEDAALAMQRSGLTDKSIFYSAYIEFSDEPSSEQLESVRSVFGNPQASWVNGGGFGPEGAPCVEVGYHKGIIDNESPSIIEACRFVGIEVVAAKWVTIYQSGDPALAERVRDAFVNPNIETLWVEPPVHETLQLAGRWEPAQRFDLRAMSDGELVKTGLEGGRNLDLRQMQRVRAIQEAIGADHVTDVLLEALDARWSDHCAHTTWKSLGNLLKKLRHAAEQSRNDNILSMFHDNAGVWRLTDDWALAVKGETHNGPSAVSAYFGQLTKLGGVLRDILGTGRGADPIGSFEYTATGAIDDPAPRAGWPTPRRIATETMDAIAEYGNTFGVPMLASRMDFHPGFGAKPFAMGGSVGLIPTAHAQKGAPESGDLVVLVGGLTGNDGIHGASASSAGAEMDATSVQIGSPLEEIMFREAVVELRDAGCVRAITDLGAAGINSAAGEMGDPVGVWVNTALVPLKCAALPMWRILLSESQERMLVAIEPRNLEETRRILARHRVRGTVIGRFDGSGTFTVLHDPQMSEDACVRATPDLEALNAPGSGERELGFSVPYELLDDEPEPMEPGPLPKVVVSDDAEPEIAASDLPALTERVLGDLRVASQAYASTRYDSSVQGNTHHHPSMGGRDLAASAYAALTPVEGSPAGALFTMAFDPWLAERHPVRAAVQMTARAVQTLCWAGAKQRDICLCDNFYTPHKAEGWSAWLVAMVDALAELSVKLGTPFISGKDSSAGSVKTDRGWVHVPPSVFISAMARADDAGALRPCAWSGAADSKLVLLGPRTRSLGGTVIGAHAGGAGHGVDDVSNDTIVRTTEAISKVPAGVVRSFMPVGAGGVLSTIAASSIGLDRRALLDAAGWSHLDWFREHRVCVVAEVDPARVSELPGELDPELIGELASGGAGLTVAGVECLTPGAIDAWANAFERAITDADVRNDKREGELCRA